MAEVIYLAKWQQKQDRRDAILKSVEQWWKHAAPESVDSQKGRMGEIVTIFDIFAAENPDCIGVGLFYRRTYDKRTFLAWIIERLVYICPCGAETRAAEGECMACGRAQSHYFCSTCGGEGIGSKEPFCAVCGSKTSKELSDWYIDKVKGLDLEDWEPPPPDYPGAYVRECYQSSNHDVTQGEHCTGCGRPLVVKFWWRDG